MQKNDELSILSRSELEQRIINLEEMNQIYKRQIIFLTAIIVLILMIVVITILVI